MSSFDCGKTANSAEEIAANIDNRSSRPLNDILREANQKLSPCAPGQQDSIADAVIAKLEANGVLPKTTLTFASDNFNLLSTDGQRGQNLVIDANSLNAIIKRPYWASPPPPIERRLMIDLKNNIGAYSIMPLNLGTYVTPNDIENHLNRLRKQQ